MADLHMIPPPHPVSATLCTTDSVSGRIFQGQMLISFTQR